MKTSQVKFKESKKHGKFLDKKKSNAGKLKKKNVKNREKIGGKLKQMRKYQQKREKMDRKITKKMVKNLKRKKQPKQYCVSNSK